MTWKFGRQTPDNNLMRFVARRFGWEKSFDFLDIGSGEGGNARELELRGHWVLTIDKDLDTEADFRRDIREYTGELGPFDCIYDINTLCHVEEPPFDKIKSWLKPNGYFFSICPAACTSPRVKEGKSFTRLLRHDEVRPLYKCFSRIEQWLYQAPDFLGDELFSWIVEARP